MYVEVVDGDDVEHVEIVLAAKCLLVPHHRILEALHRPVELIAVLGLRPDMEGHLAARARGDGALDALEVGGHQREQVGRLQEGIGKRRPVAAARELAARGLVAIGEEHRVERLVGLDAHRVLGHNVGPVEEVGDATEADGLALRAVVAGGLVQPAELRVVLRLVGDDDRELEARRGRREHGEALLSAEHVVAARHHLLAVHLDRAELEILAVEVQRGCVRRGLELDHGLDDRLLLRQGEVEVGCLDLVRRWLVRRAQHQAGRLLVLLVAPVEVVGPGGRGDGDRRDLRLVGRHGGGRR